ncbi:ComEC/Rec2 family competence protein [Burkholderia cepacia]|uniref:hypothetical protein n=1 Tax=Burkholderia cepacia TaxID=292 RepID=UPI002AB774B4|nr:hypothetical protein [Burkholderia cepacia]
MFADVDAPSFIFWPVGCGDSTTVVVSENEVLQIDLNDCALAVEDDNGRIPVVDELVSKLPKRNGEPYLSCFVLTHPDEDHCRGFAALLKRVTIGEIWHTPRIFREYHKDLCEDAQAFRKEAARRRKATIAANGDPGAGSRVRVFGYDDLLKEDKYQGLPREFLTIPGNAVTLLDGANVGSRFKAFIHAPFKDDSAEQRNETSLAMRVLIGNSTQSMAGLFFGDLAYPTMRRVFDETKAHNNLGQLSWDVLLAPHHCSRKVMYDNEDVLKQDILDDLKARQKKGAYVVSSSPAIPGKNWPGDNPPHVRAKNRYLEIIAAAGNFLCTGEYSTEHNVRPIIFTVTNEGINLVDKDYSLSDQAKEDLAQAVAMARGTNAPPAAKVGFGNR